MGERHPATNLVTDLPRTYGAHVAADRYGRTITEGAQGAELRPSNVAVPVGSIVGPLGTEGHLVVCLLNQNNVIGTVRVVHLSSGQTLFQLSQGQVIASQGQSIEVVVDCNPQVRSVDSLGRIIASGSVAALNRDVPLILTPRGVTLP